MEVCSHQESRELKQPPNCPSKEQNRGTFMSWLPFSIDTQLSLWMLIEAPMVPAVPAGVRSGRNLGQSLAAEAGVRGEPGGQKGPCHGLEGVSADLD